MMQIDQLMYTFIRKCMKLRELVSDSLKYMVNV